MSADLVIGGYVRIAKHAGAGFTRRVGGNFLLIEDREVTSTGSYGATATASASSMWTMAMVALRAAD